MPEKRRSLLDSYALVALFKRESGCERVKALLRAARTAGDPLLINEISVGEFFYATARRWSREMAERCLRRLSTLPLQTVGNSYEDVLDAARIKARVPLSYADAFVVATALRTNAVIVTGDPEFQAVAKLVKIEWL